jgi:hypothetical protein
VGEGENDMKKAPIFDPKKKVVVEQEKEILTNL